jgi:hypothetical protein
MKKLIPFLCVFAFFFLGATYGRGLFDNVSLASFSEWLTPSSTPTNSATGSSRMYYDSTNQGLLVSNNAGTPTQLMNGRNKIQNGNFNIWQRGTASVTVPTANSAYLADRWSLVCGSTGSVAMAQSTNVSGVNGTYNDIRLSQTATTNTPGAGSSVLFRQIIEGYNIIPLNNQQFTLSFWAKTNLVGTYGVSFQDSTQSVSYVRDLVVANTNWNKYVYTFTHTTGGGTWNYTTGVGLYFQIAMVAGSTFQHASGDNISGLYFGTSAMTNTWTTSSSNTMDIAQVQLEQGPTATQFEQLDFQQELTRCQRYCWINSGQTNVYIYAASSPTTSSLAGLINFPVIMRIPPTFTFAGTNTHFSSVRADGTANGAANTNPTVSATSTSVSLVALGSAATFAGTYTFVNVYWNAGATSADQLIFSADY